MLALCRYRIKTGLEKRAEVEAEAREVVKGWEASLREAEGDEEQRLADRKAVEKLEVLLKASKLAQRRGYALAGANSYFARHITSICVSEKGCVRYAPPDIQLPLDQTAGAWSYTPRIYSMELAQKQSMDDFRSNTRRCKFTSYKCLWVMTVGEITPKNVVHTKLARVEMERRREFIRPY